MCFDKRTGKPAQFTLKQPNQIVTTWPYRNDYTRWDVLRNKRSFAPAVYGGQPRYFYTDVGESTNALGLAAVGGKVYVSLNYDKLLVVDPVTGKPNGEEIHVESPVGLTPMDDHTILAVSGKQVVKVDVRHGIRPWLLHPISSHQTALQRTKPEIFMSAIGPLRFK